MFKVWQDYFLPGQILKPHPVFNYIAGVFYRAYL
jgi:hypothetical protein